MMQLLLTTKGYDHKTPIRTASDDAAAARRAHLGDEDKCAEEEARLAQLEERQ